MNEQYRSYENMKQGTELIAKRDIDDEIKCGERLSYVAICLGCGGIVVKEHANKHIPVDALHVPGVSVSENGAATAGPATAPTPEDSIKKERVLYALRRLALLPMMNASTDGRMSVESIKYEFRALVNNLGLEAEFKDYIGTQWSDK